MSETIMRGETRAQGYLDTPAEDILLVDDRESKDIKVELLYKPIGQEVLLHLVDLREAVDATFPVRPELAKDALDHPWSYYGDHLTQQSAA